MKPEIPENYKIAYSTETIRARIQQLAKLIDPWVHEASTRTGKQVLGLCVLRGGVFFFADLVRALSHSIEPTYCRTWSYSSVSNTQFQEGTRVAIDEVEAEGRAILVVDDICDTGATLQKLENVLIGLGAVEVKSCVMIRRQVEQPKYSPTWSGFEYGGAEWFVGYGLDDRNSYSNLPAVFTILR